MKNKLVIIVGPTAVGKTSLSIEVAKAFNGEIISGDSMQVYKHLDIGTAKVTEKEKEGIPHYLIDICDVNEAYSVSDFKAQASHCIDDITARGKLPIVVGGTGLYIESLIYDVSHGKQSKIDERFRKKQTDYAQTHGKRALWQKLYALDPQAAKKIHENNTRRVIRALEVIAQTGELYSKQQQERTMENSKYDTYTIGLNTERPLLYERINQRVDSMLAEGLLDEVSWLDAHVDRTAQAASGIGYKEFFGYLDGQNTLDESVDIVKKNSRHYAKRQLTWFRNRTPVDIWLDLLQRPEEVEVLYKKLLAFANYGGY